MAYNGSEVAAIARRMLADRGIDVREAGRIVDLHRTVIYDIMRGDRVSKVSLEKYGAGLGASEEEQERLLITAGYAEPASTTEAVLVMVKHRHPELSEDGIRALEEVVHKVLGE